MPVGRSTIRVALAVSLLAGMLLATQRPVSAAFHLMMVKEVYAGSASAPNSQFVELQMYQAGQNFVAAHSVIVYNSAGISVGTFTFPGNVANGASQATILIATAEAATWQFACTVLGHYQLMHGELVVDGQ